jgi:hypothetical protein
MPKPRRASDRAAGRLQAGDVYNGRAMGAASHRAIAALLERSIVSPTRRDMLAVTAAMVAGLPSIPYARAAQRRLVADVSLYFHYYPPGRGWSLEGVEVAVPGALVDLLWATPSGLVADEVKTGRFRSHSEREALARQVDAIRRGCSKRFGEGFAGVREVLLLAPALACFNAADGTRQPLVEVP